jgi:RNA polymerase sigma-70 factor (ECF subfamily)
LYAHGTEATIPEAQWVAWLRTIAGGDARALRELFEATHQIVLTFVSRIVSDRQTAEQLTVEVFYDVWRLAARFDPAFGSVLSWIMRQAHSKAIQHLRQYGLLDLGHPGSPAERNVVSDTVGIPPR